MVEVVRHKAASLPCTNRTIVFTRWRQCAPANDLPWFVDGMTIKMNMDSADQLSEHRQLHEHCTHRRNFRGYEGYAYPHFLKWWVLYPPTFKRYKRPSFELKVHRNAWAAGALHRTPLGELTALPRPPSSIKGPTSKEE